ncbi:tRNA (guanosine(46)-N7)-methyltransferase TrmB [Clostridiales bacterium COT073_COT-073]|nr:tRNA (guanosine(46)-N7)-methyltransferase TrmB [Clostridiales bacterium COT073_COT-073]
MRLRKIAGADEAVAKHERVLKAEQRKAGWLKELAAGKPAYLEIGMGKGDFMLEMADKYPNALFLGLEKYSSVLLKALQKYDNIEDKPENLWFLWENALDLADIFSAAGLDGIYLNFSDPWPKERYAKRRLTAPAFLEKYYQILKPEGRVEFKTDNPGLFDFSLHSLADSPYFKIEKIYRDLHREIAAAENVMTEYEKKFSALGHPIYKIVCSKTAGTSMP